jgi:hypothetical protein
LFLLPDALRGFSAAPDSREGRLGKALSLLNIQPRTDERIEEARGVLALLAKESPSDKAGILARFFLGRIDQVHSNAPDPVAARAKFFDLFESHPGHPVAEYALSKVVMIDLGLAASDDEFRTRAAALRPLGARLETPLGRREFHLNMAMLAVERRIEDEHTLDHFLAADAESIPLATLEADAWVATAILAQRLGRHDVARTYLEKFITRHRRDPRNHSLRVLLEKMP